MGRPTLVFVSPCTPDLRGTGWEQRAASFIAGYSKFADVDLWFQPTVANPNVSRLDPLRRLCRSVTSFYPILISNNLELVAKKIIPDFAAADCVHVFRLAEILDRLYHPNIFWDIDELPQTLRGHSSKRPTNQSEEAELDHEIKLLARLQKKCRIIYASSEIETNEYLRATDIVPNVYGLEGNVRNEILSRQLLFVGNLNFFPNIDAIEFFCRDILPLLPSDVIFRIVGRSPLDQMAKRRLHQISEDDRRVEIVYDVDDCRPCYAGASAAVVPVRQGGGTRVKILEAFGNNCPVISTTKGCEGLKVCDGDQLLVRDEPADFARACVELLDNETLGRQLAARASVLLKAEYTQEKVDRLLDAATSAYRNHGTIG